MESTSTPRISAALLDSYIGHNVIIVGKVTVLRGDVASIEADGHIEANLTRDCHLMVGNGAQIIGKVNSDLSVKVLNAIDLGPNVEPFQTIIPPTNQFSQLSIQETPQSSHTITQSSTLHDTQFSQEPPLATRDIQYTHYTYEEASSSLRHHKRNQPPQSSRRRRKTPTSSLDKNGHELSPLDPISLPVPTTAPVTAPITVPIATLASAPASAEPQYYMTSPFPLPPPVERRGRLFRTRSGNLATAAEIRRRRELEQHAEELLEMILEGFGDEHSHTITFDMNDSGRWRIVRQEQPEVEVYEDA
ncbi:uncharacterized protein F4812DRAFT_460653 [Daldinia caldariorum]|uniref:uncharacterized protein n=1 Tax=Daldinia caldariorum TaxID=326644 RepID=UPI0020085A42|nr:uncharacterized protein F4812DRAFT_460653 [Daldinia caldariorum]KAI1466380.1 hypothetical protein F4812DRAFT_460653 [Daldinia caldariorum]